MTQGEQCEIKFVEQRQHGDPFTQHAWLPLIEMHPNELPARTARGHLLHDNSSGLRCIPNRILALSESRDYKMS